MTSTSSCPFVVDQTIEFEYPSRNEIGIEPIIERRRLHIRKIRDLIRQPLKDDTWRQRPYIKRARYLIRGCDLDTHEWRSFYVDSMGNVVPMEGPLYRIGLYDPVLPWADVKYVGGVFTSKPEDRTAMREQLDDVKTQADASPNHWSVGVFQWK